jgi:hypothetical protein
MSAAKLMAEFTGDPAWTEPEGRKTLILEHHMAATVTDDWPEKVPVTEAEIILFERWFGDILDEMFGRVD